MNPIIYLDYAASTPVDPRVVEKMLAYLGPQGCYANPASVHVMGEEALQAVERARQQVAALIGALPEEIIWTSGATEANNLAIKGAAHFLKNKGKHIITLKTEHKSVLECCQQLEKEGFQVTYLTPESNGRLPMETLLAAIRPDTILVSIMWVNNEIGVIQDIPQIAALTAERNILLHVDAVQAAGKLPIQLADTPIDLLSLSAHKVYGPKGIGALYLRKKPRVRLEPQMHGGGQEQGLRSGTLPTHQIVGMGAAFELLQQESVQDNSHVQKLRDYFLPALQSFIPMTVAGDPNHCVPHILNIQFKNLLAEALLAELPEIAVSRASACQRGALEASYVLRALGCTVDEAKSAVRFSFGRFTQLEDIQKVIQKFKTKWA